MLLLKFLNSDDRKVVKAEKLLSDRYSDLPEYLHYCDKHTQTSEHGKLIKLPPCFEQNTVVNYI